MPDGAVMGTTLPRAAGPLSAEAHELIVEVEAVAALKRIEVILGDTVVHSARGRNTLSQTLSFPIPRLEPGEFLYVRVLQHDSGAAWSSPFFAD